MAPGDRTEMRAMTLGKILAERAESVPPSERLLVGISGIPASGKSTLAAYILKHTNIHLSKYTSAALDPDPTPPAVLVGLDGWHLTRAQLDAFPDAKLAHDRRGIHWTFDAPSYLSFVQAIREPISSSTGIITAPSFDHALKDPTPGAVEIHPYHRVVIIEGLYTFLDVDIWREAGKLLDERWWIDVDIEEASRRLVLRHVESGVADDMNEAVWRAKENDMPNGRFIVEHLLEPTRKIQSFGDPTLTPSLN